MSWHRHRWVLAGAKVGRDVKTDGMFTVVLYRCERCPKLRTQEVTGRWSVADL